MEDIVRKGEKLRRIEQRGLKLLALGDTLAEVGRLHLQHGTG